MHVPAAIDGLVSIEKNRDASGGFFFDGMTLPDYREGDQVEPGSSIAEVIDSHEVEIVCKINEHDRSNIKAGQGAEVELDALPGQVFHGTVKNVGGMSMKQFWDQDTGGKFDVTIQLPELRSSPATRSHRSGRDSWGRKEGRALHSSASAVPERWQARCLFEEWQRI